MKLGNNILSKKNGVIKPIKVEAGQATMQRGYFDGTGIKTVRFI
jgi:hypothetical protein